MFCDVNDFVTYLTVTCNDDTAIRAAHCMMHRKRLHTIVTLVLEIRGVHVVTIT